MCWFPQNLSQTAFVYRRFPGHLQKSHVKSFRDYHIIIADNNFVYVKNNEEPDYGISRCYSFS